MLLSIVYISHPNQTKRSVPKCRRIYVLPPPPPPPPPDKSKNLRSVKTALRAPTLAVLGLLIALAVLLPNAAAEAQTSPASTATATATATPTDYDADNDGLIDIRTLAQLNAVRYDLNGDGKQGSVSTTDWATYTAAFPNPASGMGCKLTGTPQQPTCDGYELMRDLDSFDTDGDGDVDSSDTNSYSNWTPIGTSTGKFDAVFEGSLTNGVMPKISNLTINGSSSTAEVGLFGATGSNARIENVGLVDVNVDITASASNAKIGALVGNNEGKVIACYSTGAITAAAADGDAYHVGGLVGHNKASGTITAAFSRATVDVSAKSAAPVTDFYASGGLIGHNSGTVKAAYAAGAVKGTGQHGAVGGLVGENLNKITASYSIAPVTAVGVGNSKPDFSGLIGSNASTAPVTWSYWDYISSGIDDDSGDAMPEGKSTHDLISTISATGIYADWDDLTIDGANDVDPWIFDASRFHPLLTYGGQTTTISGNQLFVNGGIDSRYGGDTTDPKEGMTLYANRGAYNAAFRDQRYGRWWMWESSTDGITWTTITPIRHSASSPWLFFNGASAHWSFVPRSEHIGKYIRAKMLMRSLDYAYTRPIGKIKAASLVSPIALSFASGHNPPRVGTAITLTSLPTSGPVAGLWYRCDTVDDTPSSTGCELVGSLTSYMPGAADLNHYIRAYIYYKDVGVWERASPGVTQQKVTDVQRVHPWRER